MINRKSLFREEHTSVYEKLINKLDLKTLSKSSDVIAVKKEKRNWSGS
jgi:hypothetical protein